jgi:hypothetical protein
MIGPTAALRHYLTQAPPGDAWIDVLELAHPGWTQPYVLAYLDQSIMVTFEDGRRFQTIPLAFRVDLPAAGVQGRQDMAITLDNVGAEIWTALELAQAQPQFPIAITWRVYLRSNPAAPGASPLRLSATNVTATENAIELTAERSDLINRRWPRVLYTSERWPGLVR